MWLKYVAYSQIKVNHRLRVESCKPYLCSVYRLKGKDISLIIRVPADNDFSHLWNFRPTADLPGQRRRHFFDYLFPRR